MAMASVTPVRLKVDDKFGAERTLRRFKRLCDAYGVVKEYRRRQEYKKPSVKNKEKIEAADKRRKKTSVRTFRGPSI